MVNRSLETQPQPLTGHNRLAGRSRRMAHVALAAGLALPLIAGCPATSEEVRPLRDQFFFPTGLAMSPDQSVLFVGNANSELRYDSGSVLVVNLDDVDTVLGSWLEGDQTTGEVPADCDVDRTLGTILQCNENKFINPEAGVRIGNFATDIGVQELDGGDLRLFVAVRGDPSVTWIDYSSDTGELSCDGTDEVPLCDGRNRLLYMLGDPAEAPLSSEPFGMYVDSGGQYALVTHLAYGVVTLVDAPRDGDPKLADRLVGLFEADPNTGVSGAVGVAGRQPGSEADLVYVTSRSEDRVQMVYVFRPAVGLPLLLPSEYFFLDSVSASDDSRGIAFNDDGTRAYIVNRDPPSVQIIDTSLDEHGFPRNRVAGVVEICRDAANLTVADLGQGERVYVTCFTSGQVWVIDPRAQSVEATITVGRGPHALALDQDLDGAPAEPRLYVGNFLEDTIAVIDLTPGADTENRVVMRLGHTRKTGDN